MRVLKLIDKKFELFILMVLLAAFSSVMMFQVIMRYFFNAPLPWAEELSRYCFVVSIAFSSSFSVKNKVLLKVDAITKLLPQMLQNVIEIIMWVIMVGTYSYLTYWGFPVVKSAIAGGQTTAAIEMPYWILYLMVEVGFGLMVIRSIEALIRSICGMLKLKKEIAAEGGNEQ